MSASSFYDFGDPFDTSYQAGEENCIFLSEYYFAAPAGGEWTYTVAVAADASDPLEQEAASQPVQEQHKQQQQGKKIPLDEEQRRKKNREAARQSRLKKKQQERNLQESLKEQKLLKRRLEQQAEKYKSLYLDSLKYFGSRSVFTSYLKLNQGLVRDPDIQPMLTQFVKSDEFKQLAI